MEKLQVFLICIFSLVSSLIIAQTGTISGTMTDESGMTVPFANVIIQETGEGFSTELDGTYSHEVAVGTYTITASYIGYADLVIEAVEVLAGQVTELDLVLKEEGEVIDEIVVTAKAIRNTEAALMTIQKRAPGLLDGVSSQAIKKSGDGDVGSAIKRVTGVSVQSGKHVVVRGLGDRYSRTILNGMDIPGLDPDKNSVQLDLFPTNIVDNLLVFKSFTPNLSGDFVGGMVDIVTKDFPDEKTFTASLGIGYNPSMHLNSNFLTYKGGATDLLGFDDGSRALKIDSDPDFVIPSRTDNNVELTQLTSSFSNTMSTMRKQNGVNSNIALSYGDQVKLNKFDFGYTVGASYRAETEYFDNLEFGEYRKNEDRTIFGLAADKSDVGELGISSVIWNTVLGMAIKNDNHKISLMGMRIQNGESRAAMISSTRKNTNQSLVALNNLEYSERAVNNFLIAGSHTNNNDKLKIDWKFSPTISKMTEPDIRLTPYEIHDETFEYEINASTAGVPTRTWRYLDENNYSGKIDAAYSFTSEAEKEHKLSFGLANVLRERDFFIQDYNFFFHRAATVDLTGNPDEIFYADNYWTPATKKGTYVNGAYEPSKTYQAKQNIAAAYAMHDFPISNSLKAIYGLRVEKAQNWYSGRKQVIIDPQTDFYDNRLVLDELDFLPSLSLVQSLANDDTGRTMNLRFSASRTLARPTFKEKSIAQIDDRISGRTFIGNIDLNDTKIINTDLRWEYFLPSNQMFSVSTFFKFFDNPIELTAFDATSPNTFTPRNAESATVAGLELEFRRNLNLLPENAGRLALNVNTTFVKSRVTKNQQELDGFMSTARDGELTSTTRDLVDQSPYVINAGLNYAKLEAGLEANLSYNVQGKTLKIAGFGRPDVYSNSFHSLDLRVSKSLGADNITRITFGARNLLGSVNKKFYQGYESDDEGIFELFDRGRAFSFGLSYRFI